MTVAVLFARADSHYKAIPDVEVFDMERDARTYDGWTLAAPQKWWGHKAEKDTWFYVVGCEPGEIPDLPYVMGEAAYVVQSRKRHDYRPHITKAEREHTPPKLATWLVELAAKCKPANAELSGRLLNEQNKE